MFTPWYLCQLEVLKEQRIFDDGYNDHNTYDDCILKEVARKYPDSNIMDIFKPAENKIHQNGMNISVFSKLSAKFEYEIKHSVCNIPNLKLQTSYILEDLSWISGLGIISIGQRQPFLFKLEFSPSTVTKEVKIILIEMLGIILSMTKVKYNFKLPKLNQLETQRVYKNICIQLQIISYHDILIPNFCI